MIMQIKIDANLAIVANRAGKDVNDMSYIMANALLNAGLIEDTDEYYGCSILDCNGNTLVSDICKVMHTIGIERINDTTFNAFAACIIKGDGDCPECGGEMELADCEGHEIPSGDRDVPPDWETDYERWRCPICGHTIEHDYRNEPDYE